MDGLCRHETGAQLEQQPAQLLGDRPIGRDRWTAQDQRADREVTVFLRIRRSDAILAPPSGAPS